MYTDSLVMVAATVIIFTLFFFNDTSTTYVYTYLHTLSLHYALPIYLVDDGKNQAALTAILGAVFHVVAQVIEAIRSEEHTSELQSLMRISYAVFCLKKKKKRLKTNINKVTIYNLASSQLHNNTITDSNTRCYIHTSYHMDNV